MKTVKTLTFEALIADRDKYLADLEAKVNLYNELNSAEERKPADVVDTRKKIDDLCASYNNASKLIAYKDLEEADAPIIEAVRVLTYGVVSVREGKQEDATVPAPLEIKEGSRAFDLTDIAKLTDIQFADKNWERVARALNPRFVYACAVNLGSDCKFITEYGSMTEIRRAIERKEYPLSRANMTDALYASVSAIIGHGYESLWNTVTAECDSEGNPLTIGNICVNYVHTVFCKKGTRALKIVCGNHKTFVATVAEVCHMLVTGESVTVESKFIEDEIKKAKRAAEKAQKKEAAKAAKEAAKAAEKSEA